MNHHFIFEKTFQHPLAARELIEFLPIDWVASLGCPKNGTEKTDLGLWINEELVTMDQLWDNLLSEGMRDPLILGVGRVCRTCRLESGNHRIGLFKNKDITLVPCVVLVGDSSISHIGNGTHKFERELLIPSGYSDFGPYPEKIYMKPSEVFSEIRQILLK